MWLKSGLNAVGVPLIFTSPCCTISLAAFFPEGKQHEGISHILFRKIASRVARFSANPFMAINLIARNELDSSKCVELRFKWAESLVRIHSRSTSCFFPIRSTWDLIIGWRTVHLRRNITSLRGPGFFCQRQILLFSSGVFRKFSVIFLDNYCRRVPEERKLKLFTFERFVYSPLISCFPRMENQNVKNMREDILVIFPL